MSPNVFFIIGIICTIVAIGGGVWWWLSARHTEFSDTDIVSIQFPNGTIHAEVATSFLKHAAGLSSRPSLDDDAGMLFVFSKPQSLTFWMKGMRFPLDFIWIRDGVIVDISRDIQPPKNALDFGIIRPKEPADMVLEINAGTIEKMDIKVGDKIEISIKN